jgi:hypothetical protein
MKKWRSFYLGILVPALLVGLGLWNPFKKAVAREGSKAPRFIVDPFWPKPLPAPGGHQWVTGEPGGSCIDSMDHVITVNRGFQTGGLTGQDGTTAIGSPPVIEYDPEGNVVRAWGDESKNRDDGSNAVMPNGIHGCFVDYQDNIWIAGNGDGVVQKWSHDGKNLLMTIGTKRLCDGPVVASRTMNKTCGSPGFNSSKTLLNDPADVAVDPDPDPITGQRGSVYIADGYGNYRVVVFSSTGKYLRQWGEPGNGPGQFGAPDGGHPHCVVLGKDGLVYACDRNNSRIEVFDKTGHLQRIIPVNIPTDLMLLGNLGTLRATDVDFSIDRHQTWMYDTDLGNNAVWIFDRARGVIVSGFGHSGHMAGEFIFPHTLAVASNGDLYVAETINGRRIQKFVKSDNEDDGD